MKTQPRIQAWLSVIIPVIMGVQVATAGGVWAVETAPPVGDGVQHEYRLVTRYKKSFVDIPIPQLPVGVTYTSLSLVDDFAYDGELTSNGGVLLRSDGRLVGVGIKGRTVAGIEGNGHEAAARIAEDFPGAAVKDFQCLTQNGGLLLFADGALVDSGESSTMPAIPPPRPAGVRYTGFVHSPDGCGDPVLLRSDGRVTIPVIDYAYINGTPKLLRTVITEANGYVGGTIGNYAKSRIAPAWFFALLLRRDGWVDTIDLSRNKGDQSSFRRAAKVPKLKKGTRYVSVSAYGQSIVYLRSDGRLIYRGRTEYTSTRRPQPPKPPTGLRYTSVENYEYGIVKVFRSDGQVVTLNMRLVDYGGYVVRWPLKLPKPAKGWKAVPGKGGAEFYNELLVEKILPGETVESGIARVDVPKSTVTGKTAKLKVKVASRAILDSGIVRVTHKAKMIGQAKVKGSTATIRIKTKTFKRKGKNTIGVQYLGNDQAKKSVKAKAILTTIRP